MGAALGGRTLQAHGRLPLTTPEAATPADEGAAPAGSPPGLTLTTAAVRKAAALLEREGRRDLRLRVAVQPGGCSGLRYQLFFDHRLLDGDQVIRFGAAEEPGPEGHPGYDSGYESGHDD
jgi:hypothetical protein